MTVSAGTVTFDRVASPATLTIQNASGPDGLTITGATLNMGNLLPVNITPGDSTQISDGTLNVNVGSLLHSGQVFVSGGGTLAMSSSGDVLVELGVSIGYPGSSTASVIVSGFGSTLTTDNLGYTATGIYVGDWSNGVLTIQSNGQVFSRDDTIGGYSAATTGTAIVTGAGSSWSNSSLTIGNLGTGTLRIEKGR